MELSVVVPVRNESENVAPLIAEIEAALGAARIEHEIVYVDDGSTDETVAALARVAETVPHLVVCRHDRSYGQSAAIRTGVKAARAPWIATIDGDGQNDPADIPRLFAAAKREEDGAPLLVAGHRRKRRDTWTKRVSSRIANGVRRRLLGDATPDTGCGLKILRREIFLDLPFFDHQHRFLPALVRRAGGRTVSVPVNHRARERGVSNYGVFDRLWVGIVDLFGVMWLQARAKNPQLLEDSVAETSVPVRRSA